MIQIQGVDRLNAAIARFNAGNNERALQIFRFLLLEGLRRVTLRMRVDTGRARGGTQISLNTTEIGPSWMLDKSGAAVQAIGASVVAGSKLGDVGHIQNNVEYVPLLEEGTEKTPPDKMFALTLQDLTEMLR